jgi:Arc/MetJ-type ribon-helix-helix transcriptional regulator
MKRINVYLTDQQIAMVEHLVQQTGLKFAELIRRLLDEALQARLRDGHKEPSRGLASDRENDQ